MGTIYVNPGEGSDWVIYPEDAPASSQPAELYPPKIEFGDARWKLETTVPGTGPDETITTGTESEVKAFAQTMVNGARSAEHEAQLRCDLFLTRPDGTHIGQSEGDGTFERGEPITWIYVDW